MGSGRSQAPHLAMASPCSSSTATRGAKCGIRPDAGRNEFATAVWVARKDVLPRYVVLEQTRELDVEIVADIREGLVRFAVAQMVHRRYMDTGDCQSDHATFLGLP